MSEEEHGELDEELDEMPRPQLTDTAILWRSYWVQWQEWADKLMDKLKIVGPQNLFSFGRKGSQKMIAINVAMLLDEAQSIRDHDEPIIAALREGQDKLRAELAASEAARTSALAQREEWQAAHDKLCDDTRDVMHDNVALAEANAGLLALLDRWVYGDTLTEDLHKLCAETATVLPPDERHTRHEQIALALSEMFKAAGRRTPP